MSQDKYEILDKNGNRRATAPNKEAAAVELKRLKQERKDFAPFEVKEAQRTASTETNDSQQ